MSSSPLISHEGGVVHGGRVIKVASVPSNHVYVKNIAGDETDEDPQIVRLPDPDPTDARRAAQSVWWPPVMLTPEWVEKNNFDIFHLQFGFDVSPPPELRKLCEILQNRHIPLVYTAHDLRNPHHETRHEHDAQLDVIISAADAIITLTEGAAHEIETRWNRRPFVIPHPHVVDFATMAQIHHNRLEKRRTPRTEFRIGVHVKSLRPNMNPLQVISTLIDALSFLPKTVLQIDGHRDILEPGGCHYDSELAEFLARMSQRNLIDLRIHDFFSDSELWEYLAKLDVSVLPYRFGTHSGWLEACRDVGTAVIAPSCGYYRDQGPVFEYTNNEKDFDATSLIKAVGRAYEKGDFSPVSVRYRQYQRQKISQAHIKLYRQLLADRVVSNIAQTRDGVVL